MNTKNLPNTLSGLKYVYCLSKEKCSQVEVQIVKSFPIGLLRHKQRLANNADSQATWNSFYWQLGIPEILMSAIFRLFYCTSLLSREHWSQSVILSFLVILLTNARHWLNLRYFAEKACSVSLCAQRILLMRHCGTLIRTRQATA